MSVFGEPIQQKIKHFLERYETKRSAILPILHAIQDAHGWVSEEHVEALHQEYDLNRVHVREVLTFYSMYRTTKPKPHEVLFCNNVVCHMIGAQDSMAEIEAVIKKYEERGEEPPFGLCGVPCLGVCDGAPAMLVLSSSVKGAEGDTTTKHRHLKVTKENVRTILEQYASR